MNRIHILIGAFLFIFITPNLIQGQDVRYFASVSEETPVQAINNLREGTLIVRLTRDQKAIEYLEKSGNSALASKRKIEIDSINNEIMLAVKEEYKFSDVLFTYGHLLNEEILAKPQSIFLGENGEVDANIALDNSRPYYFLDFSGKAGNFTKFFILDKDLRSNEKLPTGRNNWLVSTFRPESSYEQAFEKFNVKLFKFLVKENEENK